VTRSSFEKPCDNIARTLRSTSRAGEFLSRSLTRDCRSLNTSFGCFIRFPFAAQKVCKFCFACAPRRTVIDLGATRRATAKCARNWCASPASVLRVAAWRATSIRYTAPSAAAMPENTVATFPPSRHRARATLAVRPGPCAPRPSRRGPALSTALGVLASNSITTALWMGCSELARVLLILPRAPNDGWLAVRQRRGEASCAVRRAPVAEADKGMKQTTARTT